MSKPRMNKKSTLVDKIVEENKKRETKVSSVNSIRESRNSDKTNEGKPTNIRKKIINVGHLTKTGYANDKPKKFNQDSLFILKGLCSKENWFFTGVW